MVIAAINRIFTFFFSGNSRRVFEKIIFFVAIFTFIIHFLAIILANAHILPSQWIGMEEYQNPIVAIYTPFTIILLYEIYLLIYYLPKSITIYLGKQYEIVTLILIRKIFNDLANLTFTNGIYDASRIKALVFTFISLIVLMLLIFSFYKLSGQSKTTRTDENSCRTTEERKFVFIKKVMALFLMGTFIYLFINSMVDLHNISFTVTSIVDAIRKVNNTFFFTFFTALILLEVLLLLFTFNLSDKYHKVIRNSGFIISTILLKLSFRVSGRESIILILIAVAFGVAIMGVHKLYEKKLVNK